jgi:hypothetical protein
MTQSAVFSDREGGHGRQLRGVDRVERARPPRARNDPCHREDDQGENGETGSDQQPAHAVIACSAATLRCSRSRLLKNGQLC